jgi:hypothetical protein
MANKIQFRRGTTTQRTAVVLDSGEPGWDTDQKRLYVGDGITAGGVPALAFSKGHIEGLTLEWLSGTSLRVSSGSAYIPSLGYAVDVPGAITKSSLTLSANTWYHVYLFLNAGSPDIEVVTTAPDAPYSGTARAKTGDTSRRYIGNVRTDGAGAVFNFLHAGSVVRYRTPIDELPFRALSAGMATVATVVSLSAIVPTTARMAFFRYIADDSAPIRIGTSEGSGNFIYPGRPASTAYLEAPVNAAQEIFYYNTATPTVGAYIDVGGYTYER